MSLIVTRAIEQVTMAVPGVRRVRSRSIRGASEISAQFDPSTDMVVALQMVQNRIAEIGRDLPAGTELCLMCSMAPYRDQSVAKSGASTDRS